MGLLGQVRQECGFREEIVPQIVRHSALRWPWKRSPKEPNLARKRNSSIDIESVASSLREPKHEKTLAQCLVELPAASSLRILHQLYCTQQRDSVSAVPLLAICPIRRSQCVSCSGRELARGNLASKTHRCRGPTSGDSSQIQATPWPLKLQPCPQEQYSHFDRKHGTHTFVLYWQEGKIDGFDFSLDSGCCEVFFNGSGVLEPKGSPSTSSRRKDREVPRAAGKLVDLAYVTYVSSGGSGMVGRHSSSH